MSGLLANLSDESNADEITTITVPLNLGSVGRSGCARSSSISRRLGVPPPELSCVGNDSGIRCLRWERERWLQQRWRKGGGVGSIGGRHWLTLSTSFSSPSAVCRYSLSHGWRIGGATSGFVVTAAWHLVHRLRWEADADGVDEEAVALVDGGLSRMMDSMSMIRRA